MSAADLWMQRRRHRQRLAAVVLISEEEHHEAHHRSGGGSNRPDRLQLCEPTGSRRDLHERSGCRREGRRDLPKLRGRARNAGIRAMSGYAGSASRCCPGSTPERLSPATAARKDDQDQSLTCRSSALLPSAGALDTRSIHTSFPRHDDRLASRGLRRPERLPSVLPAIRDEQSRCAPRPTSFVRGAECAGSMLRRSRAPRTRGWSSSARRRWDQPVDQGGDPEHLGERHPQSPVLKRLSVGRSSTCEEVCAGKSSGPAQIRAAGEERPKRSVAYRSA